jgi:hypothetical protein
VTALARKQLPESQGLKDYAGRFGWVSTTGPGLRLVHEDDMAKGIAAAISESNAALIALVQEAAGEIERLRGVIKEAARTVKNREFHNGAIAIALDHALNPREPAS